ncbi:LacI family DNA-binding transcriptional regulator [Paracoccus tegillarcae]|nr:LacI family DNA-binding transcriptional regulator [Paracoccus tegillarcae]
MKRTSVTLADLAKQLDLSAATVSRALNGFPEVNARTRARVEQAAARLGYRPNVSAKSLVKGLVGAIGLVPRKEEQGFIDPLLAEFLDGATAITAKRGLQLSLLAPTVNDEPAAYRPAIAGNVVDAFIVSSPDVTDSRVDELIRTGFPFVLHGRTMADQPYWSYDIDNYDGFLRAARLLQDYGHTRMAFLGGRANARFATDRLAGARDALAEKGLTLPDENIRHGEMTEDLGYQAGRHYLALRSVQRPTAFLCLNIYVAMGLMRAGRGYGLRCPDDFSIIVHDDRAPYLRAEFSDPPLTAVQSSIREAGVRVTELVMELLESPQAPPRQVVAPVELVLRASVARVSGDS